MSDTFIPYLLDRRVKGSDRKKVEDKKNCLLLSKYHDNHDNHDDFQIKVKSSLKKSEI